VAWFKKEKTPKAAPARERKITIPEGLWVKCDNCKEIVYKKEVARNANVCPKCNYHFRIAALPAGLGKGVYVGGVVEGGNTWATSADISLDDLRYSFAGLLGADTIAGPVFFAYAVGESGSTKLYLTVGRTF